MTEPVRHGSEPMGKQNMVPTKPEATSLRDYWSGASPHISATQGKGSMWSAASSLSSEQQALLTELLPFGVKSHPDAPCEQCGCPLDYALRTAPEIRVCCRCLPGGRIYGYERQERLLLALWGDGKSIEVRERRTTGMVDMIQEWPYSKRGKSRSEEV